MSEYFTKVYYCNRVFLACVYPHTASISGEWTTDNLGIDILLNGQSTGNKAWDWGNWYSFSLPTGSNFNAGINTLDFIVDEPDGGQTGLGVKFLDSNASPVSTVPEPSTFVLIGAGLAGVGILRRKFRK